jgi:hypothetical protein
MTNALHFIYPFPSLPYLKIHPLHGRRSSALAPRASNLSTAT